ncbi:MAG: four helix bundle protein [bacterium]|nr:four helix bundle protein [bacterium]
MRAFRLADELVLQVYEQTSRFPTAEQFGLTSQLRRAAVSIPSNIVEGCAKASQADYVRFLNIAYGSACEAQYQLSLAHRLSFIDSENYRHIEAKASETAKVLYGLIRSLRQ